MRHRVPDETGYSMFDYVLFENFTELFPVEKRALQGKDAYIHC